MPSCRKYIHRILLYHAALQFLDVLSPWRHTTNEALAIQIQVFSETHAQDNEEMRTQGGLDVNSHEDIFNAVLNKVTILSLY